MTDTELVITANASAIGYSDMSFSSFSWINQDMIFDLLHSIRHMKEIANILFLNWRLFCTYTNGLFHHHDTILVERNFVFPFYLRVSHLFLFI